MARDSAGRRGSGSRRVGRARATASEAGRCRDAATPARDGRRSSAPCGTRGTPPRRFRRAPATRAPRRRAHRARPAPPATALAPPRSSRTARGPASSPPPRPSWAPGRYQGTPQAVTLPTRNPEEPKRRAAGRRPAMPLAPSSRRRGSVPARLLELLGLAGTERHHLTAARHVRPRLPRAQTPAEVVGFEVEHVADVLERVEPGAVGVVEPLLRLEEELLAAGIVGRGLLAVNVHRVLEDRDHQPALPVVLPPPPDPIEVLRREQRIRLDQASQSLLYPVFTFLHRSTLRGILIRIDPVFRTGVPTAV